MRLEIHFNCGCKFKTKDSKAAVEHVQKTGHIMDIRGFVRREK